MGKYSRFLIWTVKGLFLSAVIAGAAVSGPKSPGTAEAADLKTVYAFPMDCVSETDNADYSHDGVRLNLVSGSAHFYCRVYFPEYGLHRIRRITLLAYDKNASMNICVNSYVTEPGKGSSNISKDICSNGSDLGVRKFSISGEDIYTKRLGAGKGMYFNISIPSASALSFYGMKVRYRE
jgi:hypothetical protein